MLPTYNNRVRYVCAGVDATKTPRSTFNKQGVDISFADYLKCAPLLWSTDEHGFGGSEAMDGAARCSGLVTGQSAQAQSSGAALPIAFEPQKAMHD